MEERVEGAGGRAGIEGREGEEKAEGRERPEHAEERPEHAVGEGCEAGQVEQGDHRGRVAGRGTDIGVGEAGEGHGEDGERERQQRHDVEERVAEGEDRELGHGRAEEQTTDEGRWEVSVMCLTGGGEEATTMGHRNSRMLAAPYPDEEMGNIFCR